MPASIPWNASRPLPKVFYYIYGVLGFAWCDRILKKYVAVLSDDLALNEIFGRINADHFWVLRRNETRKAVWERQMVVDRKITNSMLNS